MSLIEIDGLPINKMVIFHGELLNYQMVNDDHMTSYIQVTSLKAPLTVDFPAIFDWTVSSGWCLGNTRKHVFVAGWGCVLFISAALKPSKNQLRM